MARFLRSMLCGVLLAALPPGARAETATLPPPAHRAHESARHAPASRTAHHAAKRRHHTPIVAPQGSAHGYKPRAHRPRQPRAGIAKPATGIPGPPHAAASPVQPPGPKPAAAPQKGTSTGLPLPRFAALRTNDVNLRAGPGMRYPIEWVYKRRYLPVEIRREFDVWRLVEDSDGIRGWVHQATLTGRRSFEVERHDATLRAAPRQKAAAVAILKPGVIGRIRSCRAGSAWCRVQVGPYGGYLRRGAFWGALPGEAVSR